MSKSQSERTLRGEIAGTVRAEIARQRISGSILAARLDRSASYVSRRLTGDAPFTAEDIIQIAAVLGVPTSRLLCDDLLAGAA